MKKIGFTLSEVLIALALIGVVAALTIPNFSTNTMDQTNAARLATTKNLVESAFIKMMAEEGTSTLDATRFGTALINSNANDTETWLGNYLRITGYESEIGKFDSKYSITTSSNEDVDLGQLQTAAAVKLKNNAILSISSPIDDVGNDNFIRILLVDVNGTTRPNRFGKDIFAYSVAKNGHLYPFGGLTSFMLNRKESLNAFEEESVAEYLRNRDPGQPKAPWQDERNGEFNPEDLTEGVACSDSNIGSGLGCTARLTENNYKIDYK